MIHSVSRRAWTYFWLVSALWGVPYLFIKVALEDGFSPVAVAFGRVAVGAALLLPVALARGVMAELRGRWGLVLVVAALDVAAPFALIALGEKSVSSALAGILVASTPLFVALLAVWIDPSERVSGWRFAGLLLGLTGVVALLGIDAAGGGGSGAIIGGTLIVLASLSYAAAALLVRRWFADVPPLAVSTAALALSTAMLGLALSTAMLGLPMAVVAANQSPSGKGVAAIAVLGSACTALAFLLFYALIKEAGASRAAVITYVAPAFAVAFGVVALGEPFGLSTAAGLALVLVGSWIATHGGGGGARAGPRRLRVRSSAE